ncbi:MAG: thiamine diphosphokinase [Christensenella sp.]|nr:thiamine diphosphokinase [Christensenella sp.]
MERQAICYIVCALPQRHAFIPTERDLVIAADGGYAQLGDVRADLVVGDFDSLGYVPEGEQIVRHPARKDDTDTMLAARIGLERGYRAFQLLGGVGGRLDHTLANLQTLAFLRANGAHAALRGEAGETITLIENESLRFRAGLDGILSAFCYGTRAEGVFERGFAYSLDNATLTDDHPLGVSNAFTGVTAEVSVRAGRLLIVYAGLPEDSDLFALPQA